MKHIIISALAVSLLPLSACVSVTMPDSEAAPIPAGFEERVRTSKEYPKFGDAPQAPDDTRPMSSWAKDASRLKAAGESMSVPGGQDPVSADELNQKLESLENEVNAYKDGDPEGNFDPFEQNQSEYPRPPR